MQDMFVLTANVTPCVQKNLKHKRSTIVFLLLLFLKKRVCLDYIFQEHFLMKLEHFYLLLSRTMLDVHENNSSIFRTKYDPFPRKKMFQKICFILKRMFKIHHCKNGLKFTREKIFPLRPVLVECSSVFSKLSRRQF